MGMQEARLLASLRHPNIVQFMGLCTEPACIITELCGRGSLTDVIRRAKAAPATLPWQRRLDMVRVDGVLLLQTRLKSPSLRGKQLLRCLLTPTAGDWRSKGHAVPARRHTSHGSQVRRGVVCASGPSVQACTPVEGVDNSAAI